VPDPRTSRLGHCKLCEIEDFRDPDLRELIRDLSGVGPERPDYPDGEEHRKPWEVAMTARALRDFGALHERLVPGFVIAAELRRPTLRAVGVELAGVAHAAAS